MIYSRDVAASLKFYSGLLGFKVVEQMEYKGRLVYARLRAPRGTSTIALHALEAGSSSADRAGVRLYFETKDLDKFCATLQAQGVEFSKLPNLMPWGWKHAYLNDPDGHEVSLYWAGAKRLRASKMVA